jgi:hypothetical protein
MKKSSGSMRWVPGLADRSTSDQLYLVEGELKTRSEVYISKEFTIPIKGWMLTSKDIQIRRPFYLHSTLLGLKPILKNQF